MHKVRFSGRFKSPLDVKISVITVEFFMSLEKRTVVFMEVESGFYSAQVRNNNNLFLDYSSNLKFWIKSLHFRDSFILWICHPQALDGVSGSCSVLPEIVASRRSL